MGNLGDGVKVADPGRGVARRFHMDELCVRPNRRADRFGVGRVEQRDLDVVFLRQILAEQQIRRAVADLRDNRVIAGVEKRRKHRRERGHAAGKHGAVLRTGHGAELILQYHLIDDALQVCSLSLGEVGNRRHHAAILFKR